MLSPAAIWLIAGVILCLMELFLPTAFVEFTMGISAIIVALLTPFVPHFGIQVALWLVLSVILVILVRRFLPTGKPKTIDDEREAKTLTEIPAGQTGRVLYEGNSWQAKCSDESLAIAANQPVYVVGRKGTTLIVMPESLLHS
ncbi:NfeD family protein [Oscillatoria sp. FACHB-1407]|uniref:NfeD family protein n=1 Tax=Oscillatoria sp. FACHB-1407 TaxID=2692847 RepID=UPI001685BFB3|nr:NfeD family protein [Oscillatoria sp. FACHB-1407]MBD2463881.1 NfeD family protein [Oscillatoria sp. FACHB-1407]